MQFPVHALALFAGAMVGCFVPGLIGMVSVIFVSCLVMAFAFLGFTVVHYVTRGFGSRTTLLVGFYVAIVLLSYPVSWPFLVLGLVGLIDTAFDLRRRLATKSGPPAPRT
jgi:hypothetical protein